MGPRDFHYSTLRVLEREVGGAGGVVSLVAFLGGSWPGPAWGGSWARLGRLSLLLGGGGFGGLSVLGPALGPPGWLSALGPALSRRALGRLLGALGAALGRLCGAVRLALWRS